MESEFHSHTAMNNQVSNQMTYKGSFLYGLVMNKSENLEGVGVRCGR